MSSGTKLRADAQPFCPSEDLTTPARVVPEIPFEQGEAIPPSAVGTCPQARIHQEALASGAEPPFLCPNPFGPVPPGHGYTFMSAMPLTQLVPAPPLPQGARPTFGGYTIPATAKLNPDAPEFIPSSQPVEPQAQPIEEPQVVVAAAPIVEEVPKSPAVVLATPVVVSTPVSATPIVEEVPKSPPVVLATPVVVSTPVAAAPEAPALLASTSPPTETLSWADRVRMAPHRPKPEVVPAKVETKPTPVVEEPRKVSVQSSPNSKKTQKPPKPQTNGTPRLGSKGSPAEAQTTKPRPQPNSGSPRRGSKGGASYERPQGGASYERFNKGAPTKDRRGSYDRPNTGAPFQQRRGSFDKPYNATSPQERRGSFERPIIAIPPPQKREPEVDSEGFSPVKKRGSFDRRNSGTSPQQTRDSFERPSGTSPQQKRDSFDKPHGGNWPQERRGSFERPFVGGSPQERRGSFEKPKNGAAFQQRRGSFDKPNNGASPQERRGSYEKSHVGPAYDRPYKGTSPQDRPQQGGASSQQKPYGGASGGGALGGRTRQRRRNQRGSTGTSSNSMIQTTNAPVAPVMPKTIIPQMPPASGASKVAPWAAAKATQPKAISEARRPTQPTTVQPAATKAPTVEPTKPAVGETTISKNRAASLSRIAPWAPLCRRHSEESQQKTSDESQRRTSEEAEAQVVVAAQNAEEKAKSPAAAATTSTPAETKVSGAELVQAEVSEVDTSKFDVSKVEIPKVEGEIANVEIAQSEKVDVTKEEYVKVNDDAKVETLDVQVVTTESTETVTVESVSGQVATNEVVKNDVTVQVVEASPAKDIEPAKSADVSAELKESVALQTTVADEQRVDVSELMTESERRSSPPLIPSLVAQAVRPQKPLVEVLSYDNRPQGARLSLAQLLTMRNPTGFNCRHPIPSGARRSTTPGGAPDELWRSISASRPSNRQATRQQPRGGRDDQVDSQALWRAEKKPEVKITHSDSSWIVKQEEQKKAGGDTVKVMRKLRGLLNKLTQDKFDVLYTQLLECGMTTYEELQGLMQLIFDKATTQHHYIPMYVSLCTKLNQDLVKINPAFAELTAAPRPGSEDGSEKPPTRKRDFRGLLVDSCETAFVEYRDKPFQPPAGLNEEDTFEALVKHKNKMRGTMKFIGELIAARIVVAKVGNTIMKELIAERREYQLEGLAVFLETVHPRFLIPSNPATEFWHLFSGVEDIPKDMDVDLRVRCLIQDSIDLVTKAKSDSEKKSHFRK